MRSSPRPAVGLVCLVALACAGCSADDGASSSGAGGSSSGSGGFSSGSGGSSAGSRGTGSSPGGSSTSYEPYVSATTAVGMDTAGSPSTCNLAFVISDGDDCVAKRNGQYTLGNAAVKSRIAALKKSGASVRVSFGGSSGKELGATCGSASALTKAYGAALDAAGAAQADFDIEGDELADSDSIALRSEAITLLQKERADLSVSFTLPVMPSGLEADGVALLESADDHGVQVSTVDIMTMNHGSSHTGDMGDYAITSAEAAHDQVEEVFGLSSKGAWRGPALTSMLGVNDVDGETFTVADAERVRAFAEGKGVAWVSMWSAFRDQQCEDGAASSGDAATDCSGVKQGAGDFAEAFSG